MGQLWGLTSKRLASLQILNDKLSSSTFLTLPQQYSSFRKRIIQEESSRVTKEDDVLVFLKALHLRTHKQAFSHRQFYDLMVRIISHLQFDIEGLEEYTENEHQEEQLLKVMVDLFSLFFRFVGKYFEVKDVLKGVFRSHNKTIIYDMIRFLVMFTRDYFRQIMLTLDHQVFGQGHSLSERALTEKRQPTELKISLPKRTSDTEERQQPSRKRRGTRTQNILNVEERGYRLSQMYPEQIIERAIEEFQALKRKNLRIIAGILEEGKMLIYPKIKVHFDHLYSKEEIQKLTQQECEQEKFRISVEEGKNINEVLKVFAEKEINKEMESRRKVHVKKPVRISSTCNYSLKLTHNIEKPLQLISLEQEGRKLSLFNRLPSLKETITPSLQRKKGSWNVNLMRETEEKREGIKVRVNPSSLQPRSRNSTLQKQHCISRSKVIKMSSSKVMFPAILRKLANFDSDGRRRTNPQTEASDNNDLRNVMAFNRMKKKGKDEEVSLLGIVSKQVYNVYI